MRPELERRLVGHLAAGDLNASEIAHIAGIPRSTVRDWLRKPRRALPERSVDPASLPEEEYSYLLGFYLGDGHISLHRRGVYRLRIKTDARYPGITAECADAIAAVMPRNRVLIQRMPSRAVEISSYSKAWPTLFPQHGPGRKHRRKIELAPWQARIVERLPRQFLRGLLHSDGCRVLNRVNGKDYPRYLFVQVSDDIRRLFCDACDRLGVEYTLSSWKTVSIARGASVALLDSFVGTKA
jgi:Helix-turn-helix domain